jgi:hypothetical protein
MVGPPNAWPAPGLAWWRQRVFARTSHGGGLRQWASLGSVANFGRKVGCIFRMFEINYHQICKFELMSRWKKVWKLRKSCQTNTSHLEIKFEYHSSTDPLVWWFWCNSTRSYQIISESSRNLGPFDGLFPSYPILSHPHSLHCLQGPRSIADQCVVRFLRAISCSKASRWAESQRTHWSQVTWS